MGHLNEPGGRSCRDFLKGVGAAAGVGIVAASPAPAGAAATAEAASLARGGPRRTRDLGGAGVSSADFGRMFPSLRPFAEADDRVRAALLEVGRPGGIRMRATGCRRARRR